MTGQEVCDGVHCSWDVFNMVVEVLQELHPLGLVAGDFLWFLEVLEVFMVCSDTDGVLCP